MGGAKPQRRGEALGQTRLVGARPLSFSVLPPGLIQLLRKERGDSLFFAHFGQAVAYRLFATKAYIVMPTSLSEKDKGRLEALCMLFGAGLVLFDLNKDAPGFSIRMRAQRFSPDMFYVNEFAETLKNHNAEAFEKLFS